MLSSKKQALLNFLCILILFLSPKVQAGSAVVQSERAPIFATPEDTKPIGFVKKGKKIQTLEEEGEFLKLKTKSNKPMYIRSSDVGQGLAEDDLVEPGNARKAAAREDSEDSDDFNRFSLSLSVATGSTDHQNYAEAHLGLGYYFMRWLEFQNSLFTTLGGELSYSGLDSSLRGVLKACLTPAFRVHAFGGPGYRFISKGTNVPFVEAGLITGILGFSIGGGVKSFLYSSIDSRDNNENQYFLILSGGTSF
jgi:hypothetical protein